LELSRPEGDVSRWEKVSKRLALLNKHHPLKAEGCTPDKLAVPFQTPKQHATKQHATKHLKQFNGKGSSPTADEIDGGTTTTEKDEGPEEVRLFRTVRNAFIDEDLVFFGGYAISHYARHLPKSEKALFAQIPHFDVLSVDPEASAAKVKERLEDNDFTGVSVTKHSGIGEIVPEHYEITVGKRNDGNPVAFIYRPVACHSYNVTQTGKRRVRIASTDTMLSLYLAMIYTDKPYYDVARILCMCKYLYDIQQRNRLKQTGLLRRFGLACYGKQETLDDIKAAKAEKYQQLKHDDPEYEEWFLKYSPMEYFEHTYNPKKHKLTVKRSPNAKKSPSQSLSRSRSLSPGKSPSPKPTPKPSPKKTRKTKTTLKKKKKTQKSKPLINNLFKIIT
jgi:hypothetical protein